MVSKSDLKLIETYQLIDETRYRICVKGTNIIVNVSAPNEDQALEKALSILIQAGLDDETLEKVRKLVGNDARC